MTEPTVTVQEQLVVCARSQVPLNAAKAPVAPLIVRLHVVGAPLGHCAHAVVTPYAACESAAVPHAQPAADWLTAGCVTYTGEVIPGAPPGNDHEPTAELPEYDEIEPVYTTAEYVQVSVPKYPLGDVPLAVGDHVHVPPP